MTPIMIIKSALASPLKLPAQAAALAALLATGVAGQGRLPTPEAAKAPPDARYELIISETEAQPAGTLTPVLVVNGSSPGPVLRFTEGDKVQITVKNRLVNEETSIHWHGLLVPNQEDGVPYLTTPPIPPGGERTFAFTLRQSGTYWYHSHTGLQEQRGVQGAIVIEPREPDVAFDREHVVVLGDWTNENPTTVMRWLMRGSEWYSIKKGTQQSLWGAYQRGALGDYFEREGDRMPPMDLSDVGYDAFLANGKRELPLAAKPGERVLLRFVNAGASSYFFLAAGNGNLTIVGSDGQRVEPVEVRRLLVGMAETYDVIVTMPADASTVEVRATAQDGSGHASLLLGTGPLLAVADPPRANLYSMDEMLQAGLASMIPKRAKESATTNRPFAPYALLRATRDTSIAAAPATIRKLTMRLTGDMRRYLWGFDNETLSENSTIRVKKGEVLRIELINDTMMHHPLHLHGHFFRLLNGQGERAPLKHTVDVPPMGKRTIEWLADEEGGDWFFHCHLLYHMDAGMARVFTYSQDPQHEVQIAPGLLDPAYVFLDASIQNHMTMGRAMVMKGRNDFFTRWDVGLPSALGDTDHDHGSHHDRDIEVDVGWSRYIDQNWATELGFRYADVNGAASRSFAGVRHRLPYLVMSNLSVDTRGDFRITLDKAFQLTDRVSVFGSVEYDTNTYGEWIAGFDYVMSQSIGFSASYHSDHGYGLGLVLTF
ncbi:MAG: FtsP/CotA-like multicopper oxidase with cupredoxin domain [Acidimicrobiales bacterium]|jgi:FtsP/CotA-like multicopper oxidase with cupredoxin domain